MKVWIADYEDADQVFDKEKVMSPLPKRLQKVQDDIIHDGKVTKHFDFTGHDVEHNENFEDISLVTSDASYQVIIIIIIGIYIAPFPFIKCSKALHIVIV